MSGCLKMIQRDGVSRAQYTSVLVECPGGRKLYLLWERVEVVFAVIVMVNLCLSRS